MDTKEVPKAANPYILPTSGKCFKYNQLDHRSSDCPLTRAVHFFEKEEEEENEVHYEPDGDGDEVEDYEDDDEGRNYVVRKLMFTLNQEANTQHHQLFRTICTINNKLFELIIESGSFENIISRGVLKLPAEKHPNPYTY